MDGSLTVDAFFKILKISYLREFILSWDGWLAFESKLLIILSMNFNFFFVF